MVEEQKLDLASRIESKASAWTVEGLTDLLGVSPKTLYKMASSGRLPVIRIGGMLSWIFNVNSDVMKNHGDVWNESVTNLVRNVIVNHTNFQQLSVRQKALTARINEDRPADREAGVQNSEASILRALPQDHTP